MRRFARTLRPNALITCNNSLNSPDVLFSQSRGLGYNIFELSKTEDFVVVEDMATQPRVLPDGRLFEYGSTYRQLHAISHGKPVVAVTIAEADYHTPARLVRLAMAEAAAHGASYLSWPTWPESDRARMAASVRPQADLLRAQERWLNDTHPRRDAVLFLPFQRWIETDACAASRIAQSSLAPISSTKSCPRTPGHSRISPGPNRICRCWSSNPRACFRHRSNGCSINFRNGAAQCSMPTRRTGPTS